VKLSNLDEQMPRRYSIQLGAGKRNLAEGAPRIRSAPAWTPQLPVARMHGFALGASRRFRSPNRGSGFCGFWARVQAHSNLHLGMVEVNGNAPKVALDPATTGPRFRPLSAAVQHLMTVPLRAAPESPGLYEGRADMLPIEFRVLAEWSTSSIELVQRMDSRVFAAKP